MSTTTKKPRVTTARRPKAATSSRKQKLDDLPTSESLGYLIRETHRAFMRALEVRIAKHGISSGMWWFLRLLWTGDGLTQSELSDRLKVMGPTTVRAMDRLEKFGLIRREPSADDKRKVFIYLTDKGRDIKDEVMPYVHEVQDIGSRDMSSDEVRTLRSLLNRALKSLDEDRASTASS